MSWLRGLFAGHSPRRFRFDCVCKIYGRKRGTGRGFSPRTSAFPSHDHYTKIPYFSSFLNYGSEGRASEKWERSNSNPAVHCEVGGAFGQNSSLHTLVYSPQRGLLEFFLWIKLAETWTYLFFSASCEDDKMTYYLQLHLYFPICQFKCFYKGTTKLCIYFTSQYAARSVSGRLLRVSSLNRIHFGTKWKRRTASRKALFSASKDWLTFTFSKKLYGSKCAVIMITSEEYPKVRLVF